MSEVQILVPEKYFIKDPNSSDLGKRIIREGVELLDELGYEDFNFRKLAAAIGSTEASVYRYFENKLKFLLYISTLYWRWISYLIDMRTYSLNDPEIKLREICRILLMQDELERLSESTSVDIMKLRSVVMLESDKTYLTKKVDQINKEGLFRGYKDLCHKIALVIMEINPDYPYPHTLVSTVLEASNQQVFFALHLPSLTEIDAAASSLDEQVFEFLYQTMTKVIKP